MSFREDSCASGRGRARASRRCCRRGRCLLLALSSTLSLMLAVVSTISISAAGAASSRKHTETASDKRTAGGSRQRSSRDDVRQERSNSETGVIGTERDKESGIPMNSTPSVVGALDNLNHQSAICAVPPSRTRIRNDHRFHPWPQHNHHSIHTQCRSGPPHTHTPDSDVITQSKAPRDRWKFFALF